MEPFFCNLNVMRIIIIFFFLSLIACSTVDKPSISIDEVHAWCIVPFDSEKRTPAERIEMLKGLGIKSYVYDWREEHLDEMVSEWKLAKEQGIDVKGVWLWIDANHDSIPQLSENSERVLKSIAETDLQTEIWLGFHSNYFEGLDDKYAVNKGAETIKYFNERATAMGCSVKLYNHGDWFGEPENQIKIIEHANLPNVQLVYNFHHGHHHIDRFPELVKAMMPYLGTVNINGMEKDGSKILPVGQGDYEKEMMNTLIKEGYNKPFGILGHVDNADVNLILKANLDGLKDLFSE